MAILVTGGTGFVGLNLVEALLARGDSVVILSNGPLPGMAEPVFARLPGRLTVIAGDVRDARLVGDAVRRHGIERIVAYVTFFDAFGAAWDDAMVARWSAKPLCMLWPEMDAAFLTSGGNGGPPGCGTAANRHHRRRLDLVTSGVNAAVRMPNEVAPSSRPPQLVGCAR